MDPQGQAHEQPPRHLEDVLHREPYGAAQNPMNHPMNHPDWDSDDEDDEPPPLEERCLYDSDDEDDEDDEPCLEQRRREVNRADHWSDGWEHLEPVTEPTHNQRRQTQHNVWSPSRRANVEFNREDDWSDGWEHMEPVTEPTRNQRKEDQDLWSHSLFKCIDQHTAQSTCLHPMDCPWHDNGTLRNSSQGSRQQPVEPPMHNPWDNPDLLPSQRELNSAAHQILDGPVAFMACLDTQAILNATTVAPHKLRLELADDGSFEVIWDSGASHSITNDEKDFVGPIRRPGLITTFTGMAKGLHLKGVGEVEWSFIATNGKFRTIRVPAHYVPNSPAKLLSTSQVLQQYPNESIELSNNAAMLTGVQGDDSKPEVKVFVNPMSNIPTATGYRLPAVQRVAEALNVMTTAVDPRNVNLSDPEMGLL